MHYNVVHNLHQQAFNEVCHTPKPAVINYQKEDNPFKARYGDNWEVEIQKCKEFNSIICVKELVRHINEKTKQAYQGTKYEDTYLFYHDALSQMTDRDCVEWMREEGILSHWTRPVLGLNDCIEIEINGTVKKNRRYKMILRF